jgi:hypothetical protein
MSISDKPMLNEKNKDHKRFIHLSEVVMMRFFMSVCFI